jgi:Asp-tRNA(Asn)/Glu-tRNA(Gln) amidotransferase A subunit family amidase
LNLLSATQAAEKIASGETTSLAVVEDCVARIAAREPHIRAWAFIDPEMARRQARARDQEPRRSAFHGLPIGIKDIFDTFDMPTAYGSPIYKGHKPATDTAIVGLLRRAGLVILGKCATTEFASPVPVGVKNPHDFGRSPGVSSSGSAAAVADFMVPLSVGSQTGGSTILPAAFCGVFGFKASLTGIDRGGVRHLRPGLDTMGLFARELRDIATLQAIVTGVAPVAPPAELKSIRVGICRTLNWHQALPESVDALERAAEELRSRAAAAHEVNMPDAFVGIEDSFRIIGRCTCARHRRARPFRSIEPLGASGAKDREPDRPNAVR